MDEHDFAGLSGGDVLCELLGRQGVKHICISPPQLTIGKFCH